MSIDIPWQLIYDLETKVNASVFPGLQGGPHIHTIAALAVALQQTQKGELRQYQQRILRKGRRSVKGFVGLFGDGDMPGLVRSRAEERRGVKGFPLLGKFNVAVVLHRNEGERFAGLE